MAKAELFRVPLLGRVIRSCGAYPVSRGASDRQAIRTASERLAEGWATGVFLDGTRQSDGRVNTPQPGAALLARRYIGALRRSGHAVLVAPVATYMVLIAAMAVAAAGSGAPVAAAGAAAFLVSDSLIAESRFVAERRWHPVAIMVTYHAALAGLVLGLL